MKSVFRDHHFATKITTILGAAGLCLTWVTQAQQRNPFLLTVYADAPGGVPLVSGHYNAALLQIRSAPQAARSAAVLDKTNACVAYAALRQLTEARAACDAAVTATDRDKTHSSGKVWRSWADEDESAAIAYANRAVVHSLAHEAVSSAEDLAEAHSLAPTSEFVVRNIAAFRQLQASPIQVEIVSHPIIQ